MTDDLGTIAHFKLLEKLGQGGMGLVYRAEDTALGRTVALKVLPPATVGDERAKRRLLREARSAAAVQHPNIASIFEVGEDAGRVYVAMELVEGITLRRQLQGGRRLPIEEAMRIARAVASGLARAHDKGIIHRDIKPDNVMIDAHGDVKILDFGLAKTRDDGAPATNDEVTVSRLTQDGEMMGTPAYMAPEQVLGDMALDQRADVFSFGVLLYEMVAGVRPFHGATSAEIIAAVLRDEPDPPSKHVTSAPVLDALILRCLAKKPAARFASARELLEALEAISAARPGDDPNDTTTAAPSTISGLPEPPQPAPRTRPWLRPAVIGAALAAAAALAIRARSMSTDTPPSAAPSSSTAVRGIGILDVAPPRCNAAAQLEYRAGLQAMRDIGWSASEPRFQAAARVDPECADAHLRIAQLSQGYAPAQSREAYQRASALRERLSDRGRAVLDALEPTLAAEPPDTRESRRRLAALATRFTDDVEILTIGALASEDPAQAIAYARRALAIDPGHADAWQAIARASDRKNDIATARQAIDDCVRAAPAAIDCRFERVNIDRRTGECDAMVTHTREAIAKSPSVLWTRGLLATALASQGASRELVTEVLLPFWAALAPDEAYRPPHQRALIAALYGDFAAATRESDALGRAADARPELAPHVAHVLTRIALLTEIGDRQGAARFADDVARRAGAWSRPPLLARNIWGLRTFEPQLAAALSGAEMAERERLMKEWRGWLQQTDMDALAVWAYGDASFVATRADAQRSLERTTASRFSLPSRFSLVDGYVGHALLLGGRASDAVSYLAAATQRCDAAEYPFEHTRAFLWLGEAHEAAGDAKQACEAYAVVLRRWGAATTTSLTATTARERATKLGCAK